MANEPQDLTLAEKAEYKLLSLNPFNNAKRQQRLKELNLKKQAYEEYQKQIYQHNQKVIATAMYASRRDEDIKKLLDRAYSFVRSLLKDNAGALGSLIRNQSATREESKRVLEDIVDARVPAGGNFDEFFSRYNGYLAVCIARFLDSAFDFTKDDVLKTTYKASSNKILHALKDIILQYDLDFTCPEVSDGKDFSIISERQSCYDKLVRVLKTEKYSNPSFSDELFDWQESGSIFVVTTNAEIAKLRNNSNRDSIDKNSCSQEAGTNISGRVPTAQSNDGINDFIDELAAEKQAKEAQAKAKEPTPPNAENKYTIYSSDEVSLIAKRVLDDMPSDIFGIELLTLKQNMLKKFIAEKDDFKPGDDLRFYMYKAFYGHTYDLLLNDQCYFMGDFTPIGRDIYRLCTYCLDESHRLGYVDDDLYKAQKNNISINVRNGKSFS